MKQNKHIYQRRLVKFPQQQKTQMKQLIISKIESEFENNNNGKNIDEVFNIKPSIMIDEKSNLDYTSEEDYTDLKMKN